MGAHPDTTDTRIKYVHGKCKRTLAITFGRPKFIAPLEIRNSSRRWRCFYSRLRVRLSGTACTLQLVIGRFRA
jgi:hypothetical protein